MQTQRRRRVTPVRQKKGASRARTVRKTRPSRKVRSVRVRTRRPSRPLKERLMQTAIAVFLIADAVLIFYLVRHCSGPVSGPEPGPGHSAVEPAPVEPEVPPIMKIQVLNGCGITGVAARFTDYLRDPRFEGRFDVVETGNYEEDRPTGPNFNLLQTLIIDRRGNLKSCERLAEALGLPRDRIVQDVNDAYVLDVSLVIGKDYEYLSCWQAMENPYE